MSFFDEFAEFFLVIRKTVILYNRPILVKNQPPCSRDGNLFYNIAFINIMLYDVVKEVYGEISDEEKKAVQAKFFKDVYMLLISRETGPRLYLFLAALDKMQYIKLLDFDAE